MKENLRNKRGITLIALVITIIVMLILVAVSVTVALQGGLFQTAKTAVENTTAERDRELALSDGSIVDQYTGNGEIDFDAIKADVIANPQTYLAKAQAAGQNVASNTDIGIGTDGEIVNLDLWTYTTENNAITLSGGTYSAGYKGEITDGKIEGTVPQYIYKDNEMLTVTMVTNGAFCDLTNLKEIIIPSSVTIIGRNSFMFCRALESITIPDSVTSIGERAFEGCNALESVKIGSSLTSIGSQAFNGCISLSEISLPNSVTDIYYMGSGPTQAFVNCTALTSIEIDNTEGSISGSPWGASNATVTWLR